MSNPLTIEEVTCAACGFLAKHITNTNIPPPRVFEMDSSDRQEGNAFNYCLGPNGPLTPSSPICYRHAPASQRGFSAVCDWPPTNGLHISSNHQQAAGVR